MNKAVLCEIVYVSARNWTTAMGSGILRLFYDVVTTKEIIKL